MTGFKYEGSDVKQITDQVTGLADLLGAKTPSEKGLVLWVSCLKDEVPAWAAISALTDWPKRHSKMAAPSDIVKSAKEIRERAQEKKVQEDSAKEVTVSAVTPADPAVNAAYHRWLTARHDLPALTGKEWMWRKLIAYAEHRPLRLEDELFVRKQFGDTPSESAITEAREGLRKREEAEAAIPPFLTLIAEERAKSAKGSVVPATARKTLAGGPSAKEDDIPEWVSSYSSDSFDDIPF